MGGGLKVGGGGGGSAASLFSAEYVVLEYNKIEPAYHTHTHTQDEQRLAQYIPLPPLIIKGGKTKP